ncbi:MAG TPA: methyltransferase domain-containing protein [Candidatus Omnitrophota bacterium]|nr:methyltransferase domain-containing protein [Candidatus Omnitrophota bacterium]
MSPAQEIGHCKICHTNNLITFISFGEMPVANAFLRKEEVENPSFKEFKYEMKVGFCENCKMVQLVNIVPYEKYIVPDEKGKRNYAFFASTSKVMEQHFSEIAKEIENRFLDKSSKILEIGSNDGIFLKAFKSNPVLGIEPSDNVAEIAKKLGIETITEFFSESLARRISLERGKFKAIFSANVILNIIDLHDLLNGINYLLEDNGAFIFEDPYIVDILKKVSYDQIYDEHIWYFSLTSLNNLLKMHGLELFDAEKLETHGGSMRKYVCKKGKYPPTERLLRYLAEERDNGINTLAPYLKFAKEVEESKEELIRLLRDIKSKGKKIVGYAAASKGTIVQNYCGIGRELIDYISDSTPFKQGLYSPGNHIPVVAPEYFHNDKKTDYALLGAWNHADEIIGKEKEFIQRGGRFIVHYPKARILESGNLPDIESHADTTQSSDLIPGVEVKKLKIFANDQGYLFETLRNDDAFFNGVFGQVLMIEIYPGVIKGYHLHKKHDEYITCVKGNVKYVIVQENPNGTKKINKFVIGEKNPALIKVPKGLWRAYMPLGNQPAMIMDVMSRPYDSKDPDTEEKGIMDFGDVWTVKNG